LAALRKITLPVLLMCGRNDGIAVHIPKESVLKEMAAKIQEVKPAFFDLVEELSDRPLY
jgi:pimeloyl-ACP methyl ester carboxylesterase